MHEKKLMKKNWEITRSEWPSVYIQKFSKFFATMHDLIKFKKKWKIDRASQDEVLHTLRSVPWPPSCCLYQPTPFEGSAALALAHSRSVHPASPVLLSFTPLPIANCQVLSAMCDAIARARVWKKKWGEHSPTYSTPLMSLLNRVKLTCTSVG